MGKSWTLSKDSVKFLPELTQFEALESHQSENEDTDFSDQQTEISEQKYLGQQWNLMTFS